MDTIQQIARRLVDEIQRWETDGQIPTGQARGAVEGHLSDLFAVAKETWDDLAYSDQQAVRGIWDALRGTGRDWLSILETHELNPGKAWRPCASAIPMTPKTIWLDVPASHVVTVVRANAEAIAGPVSVEKAIADLGRESPKSVTPVLTAQEIAAVRAALGKSGETPQLVAAAKTVGMSLPDMTCFYLENSPNTTVQELETLTGKSRSTLYSKRGKWAKVHARLVKTQPADAQPGRINVDDEGVPSVDGEWSDRSRFDPKHHSD